MKKNFFVLLFLLVAGQVSAQFDVSYPRFVLMPQAGFNLSRLSSDTLDGGRVGLQLGVTAQVGITPRFYAQPSVYTLRQFPAFFEDAPNQTTQTSKDLIIHGIQIQTLAGYHILDKGIFRLRGHAGPSLSLVTQVKPNQYGLRRSDFKPIIWGAKVGAGLDISFLTLDVSYEHGLSPVFESGTERPSARNHVLSVNLGVKLGFGRFPTPSANSVGK
jgi:hypothetical protein